MTTFADLRAAVRADWERRGRQAWIEGLTITGAEDPQLNDIATRLLRAWLRQHPEAVDAALHAALTDSPFVPGDPSPRVPVRTEGQEGEDDTD